ncbi:penicillin-binding protein activator [Marinobacter caseinilyticus]|uniref:penicillin-binding protein activator n=1 Tax=Marinobacter caseinilyticus TaxID=2692195 RepID=UPI00140A06F8|nr:penicillin-binding protein activator [Marinobacter caseinilyticus]
MITNHLNARYIVAILALLFTLGGCAPINLQSGEPQTADVALALADEAESEEAAQRYLLQTADRFQAAGAHKEARTILQNRRFDTTVESLKNQYLLLAMSGVAALEDRLWAQQLSETLSSSQFQQYRADLVEQALELQLATFDLAQQPMKVAQTLIVLKAQPLNTDTKDLNDRIWQALKRTSSQVLNDESQRAIGYDTQGWLELAIILRSPGMRLEAQSKAIRDWQYNWAGHPAARELPSELSLITLLAQERPEKITLAVPLTGPLASAGAAVRDGFMAAFYTDTTAKDFNIEISVTDTHGKPFDTLYEELLKTSPDLIVGPLNKEALAAIAGRNAMPIPLLALNYDDSGNEPPARLYQFGLSAEDEARQIAERLHAEGLKQVLALIPGGDWGDRFEQALLAGLDENEGTALQIQRFFRTDNLRAVSADLLGVNVSRQRAIEVEQTIGQNVEFEPRRRQDVDAIIMVAQPTVARQFKPLFAFYFAGDLPVYSPSLIYEGRPDPARDRDLDQVVFTDIPWVLDEQNPLRSSVRSAFPNMGGQLGRLFAMGADAFQLSARLPLLEQVQGSTLDGHTGVLTMSEQGKIHRKQRWARFEQGAPKPLPELVEEESGDNLEQMTNPTPQNAAGTPNRE